MQMYQRDAFIEIPARNLKVGDQLAWFSYGEYYTLPVTFVALPEDQTGHPVIVTYRILPGVVLDSTPQRKISVVTWKGEVPVIEAGQHYNLDEKLLILCKEKASES